MRKLLIAITVMCSLAVSAQENWSLVQCIEYAHSKNLEILRQELNTEYQKNLLHQNKSDRLPNLNARVSQNFGFGRVQNQDGVLVSSNAATTNMSINSSMPLYQGGALKNNIRAQESNLKASLEDLQKAKDDISINISQAYLEILFAEEIIKVSEQQLEQTQVQLVRSKQLVQAGKMAEGMLLEIKAQEARETLEVVNAKNNYRMTMLNLVQMLELDDYEGFAVVKPELPEIQAEFSLLTAKEVFNTAVNLRPEVKSAEYSLESSEARLSVARAANIPSLSASIGLSDQYITDYGDNVPSWGDQLEANTQSYVGLNLDIPIFNRFSVDNSIKNSQIDIDNKKLQLEQTKKELRRQIEQAYINALASYERFNANKVAVQSMEESFRFTEQKFDLGRVNSVEFNDVKTRLATAQSDLVQAKYEFIFRSKILDFYNGVPIVL